jgi:hypothetical protein
MSQRLARVLALCAPFALLACGTLIGLGDLDKADCVGCAGAAGTGQGGLAAAGGNVAAGGVASSVSVGGYASVSGSSGGGTPSSAGTGIIVGGTFPNQTGGDNGGGAGGDGATSSGCPGGPMPPFDWKESWYEHSEQLTRVYYDDCIALYFDADVAPTAKDWLVPFLDASWSYTLATYGQLGPERLYVVVHQGKFVGGHSATYGEDSHGHHSVIDMGLDSWASASYDLPAHLMGFIVDTEGAHTKLGAPKSEHYGNEGFPLIYKYDLYVALGLTSTASSALSQFNSLSNSQPYAGTFWFRDWFYPLWRDHGRAQVFANYMSLLQDHYPVDNDGWMPTMNYGQYIHFMSGAAGENLEPLARDAFQWHPDFDAELAAAKADFSAITY